MDGIRVSFKHYMCFICIKPLLLYSALFPRVWIASAFKGILESVLCCPSLTPSPAGAFGETLTVPNARWHLDNNMAWLSVAREQRPHFAEVRGLVLTGWQRYE
jgi:hexosaminidase